MKVVIISKSTDGGRRERRQFWRQQKKRRLLYCPYSMILGLRIVVFFRTEYHLPLPRLQVKMCKKSKYIDGLICTSHFKSRHVYPGKQASLSSIPINTPWPRSLHSVRQWFFQIPSQWEPQKNRFSFVSFGKNPVLPPCIWDLPFMSYRLR